MKRYKFFIILSIFVLVYLCNNYSYASFIGTSPSFLPLSNCTTGLNCGLVGYWTFDGKDMIGGVARDRSGNGNSGNLINIASSTFYTSGKIGQAVNFDGTNDYVSMGDILDLNGGVPFSISAWVVFNDFTNSPSVVGKFDDSGSYSYSLEMGQLFETDGSGLGLMLLDSVNGGYIGRSTSRKIVKGAWYHIVGTYDGGSTSSSVKLYYNGVQVDDTNTQGGTFTTIRNTSTPLTIGSLLSSGNPNYLIKGKIDEVRIYSRVLSTSEITQLYSSGASNKQNSASVVTATTTCSVGLSCGLVTYWSFDGKDIVNGVVRDNSGNGTFANIGNISSSTFYTAGVKGQALKFTSNNDYIYSDLGTTRSTFTISLWYTPKKAGDWQNNQTGFHMGRTSFGSSNFFRWYSTGGYSKIEASSNNDTSEVTSSTYSSETRLPYFNTFVFTPTQIDWYINGVLHTSITASVGTFDAMRFIRLGGTGNANQSANGVIDEFRMYDRVLTVGEIKQLYNSVISTKQSASQNIIQNSSCISGLSCGLVGYWTFDGKDMVGGVARDRSGNGNNGNLINIATSTFYTMGKIGQGISFDGTDKYIDVGNTSSLSITNGSISAWFRINAAGRHLIVSKTNMNSNTNGYGLDIENNAPYRVNLLLENGSSGNAQIVAGLATIEFNKWYHVVATWDGTTINMYLNGLLDKTTAQTTVPITNVNNLYIGKDTNLLNSKMNGKIDDLRIYNRAISATEVLQLYNLGK